MEPQWTMIITVILFGKLQKRTEKALLYFSLRKSYSITVFPLLSRARYPPVQPKQFVQNSPFSLII